MRLIVPLEKCRVQKPMADGKLQMAVTQRRICEWGYGLVGVCVESHLRPAHNKREYLSQATNSAMAGHTGRSMPVYSHQLVPGAPKRQLGSHCCVFNPRRGSRPLQGSGRQDAQAP